MPAFCFPLRAQGRWCEWSYDSDKINAPIERIVSLNTDQSRKLIKNGAYLAVYISGGSNLSTDWELSINGIKLDGPFIPAMAISQDLSLVRKNPNNELTVEQEWIFKHLCNLSSTELLDLRQWFLVPIYGQQWQQILPGVKNKQIENVRITIRKCHANNGAVYGAYPFNQRYSTMPSLFRFSWEKCLYGVEGNTYLDDPTYDQSLKLLPPSFVPKEKLADSYPGVYLKLLLPPAEGLLPFAETKYPIGGLNDSNTPAWPLPMNEHGYCLIRMFGQTQIKDEKYVYPWVSVNMDQKYFYRPVWMPRAWKANTLNNSSKNFDFCFPMLIDAFPAKLRNIELHMDVQNNSSLKKDVRCYLKVYKIPLLPSGMPYEIL